MSDPEEGEGDAKSRWHGIGDLRIMVRLTKRRKRKRGRKMIQKKNKAYHTCSNTYNISKGFL
ncbi:hypothetical protein C5167_021300 [Papaver somniferum]|uniref:Uncharacterized protein n=1 Tax=Papaver somniferum TaxID=3469 RepID=A0A4Y7IYK9_PAPSO|nr:hypothetical protein C5167_021300 [Papaver somniferum]